MGKIANGLWVIPLVLGVFLAHAGYARAGNRALAAPPARTGKYLQIERGLRSSLVQLQASLSAPTPQVSTRDLINGALASMALGLDPQRAQALLSTALGSQDMELHSAGYGSIPWQINNPGEANDSSLEMAMQPIGPLLLGYGNGLSVSFRQAVIAHVRAALSAMRRHAIPIANTSIYLMRSVNFMLLGQVLRDTALGARGYGLLLQWIQYTNRFGIHEFDSPTAYAVDLDSLEMGYLWTALPAYRDVLRRILDYLWEDIAANTFDGSLSGPNSSNPNFIGNEGILDLYLYTEGLRSSERMDRLPLDRVFTMLTGEKLAYHPDRRILDLARLLERTVAQRWALNPSLDRYNFMTRDFEIGSASGDYSGQDKMITVHLRPAVVPSDISVVPEMYSSPYGTTQQLDASGQSAAQHLALDPVTVQQRGAVLMLLNVNASKSAVPGSVSTNILLPAARAFSLRLDKQVVVADKPFSLRSGLTSIITVRSGTAAVAIRIFRADGCTGKEPRFALEADRVGLRLGVARYTIYHDCGRFGVQKRYRVGLLMVAAPVHSSKDFDTLVQTVRGADIQDTLDNNVWSVTAYVGDQQLAVRRNTARGIVLYRQVNGHAVQTAPLQVNGHVFRIG